MSISNENRQSQVSMLADHLITNGSISDLEAFDEYGIRRLSARIWDLRHKYGMAIESVPESGKNRYGKKINYCRYRLEV